MSGAYVQVEIYAPNYPDRVINAYLTNWDGKRCDVKITWTKYYSRDCSMIILLAYFRYNEVIDVCPTLVEVSFFIGLKILLLTIWTGHTIQR